MDSESTLVPCLAQVQLLEKRGLRCGQGCSVLGKTVWSWALSPRVCVTLDVTCDGLLFFTYVQEIEMVGIHSPVLQAEY